MLILRDSSHPGSQDKGKGKSDQNNDLTVHVKGFGLKGSGVASLLQVSDGRFRKAISETRTHTHTHLLFGDAWCM